jgi:O-antigen/teichoic acid export membrane protein
MRATLALVKRGETQSLVTGLNLTILASMVILFANVGSGIVLARVLGPVGRGTLTAALLFGPLIASIGGLGIADALVYVSGRSRGARTPSLMTALWIAVPQSVILVIAGWVVIPLLLRPSSHLAISPALAYLPIIPLFFLSQYPSAVLQGRLRLAEFNLVRACAPIVYTATVALLWHLNALSVEATVAASLLSGGVACLLALPAALRFSTQRFSQAAARELLAYGARSQGGNLATILMAQLDLLMLAALVPTRDLGYYAVATSAAMTGSLVPSAVSLVLFPTFANQSREAGRQALARFLLWGVGGAALLTPLILFVVPWAVVPIYGQAFSVASSLSVVLVPAYLLRGSNQMLVAILRGFGSPARASAGQVVGLAVLAVSLPIGISAGGIHGAAIALIVSAAAAFVWLLINAWRHGQLSFRDAALIWRSDLTRLYEAILGRRAATKR